MTGSNAWMIFSPMDWPATSNSEMQVSPSWPCTTIVPGCLSWPCTSKTTIWQVQSLLPCFGQGQSTCDIRAACRSNVRSTWKPLDISLCIVQVIVLSVGWLRVKIGVKLLIRFTSCPHQYKISPSIITAPYTVFPYRQFGLCVLTKNLWYKVHVVNSKIF